MWQSRHSQHLPMDIQIEQGYLVTLMKYDIHQEAFLAMGDVIQRVVAAI